MMIMYLGCWMLDVVEDGSKYLSWLGGNLPHRHWLNKKKKTKDC